MIEVELEKYQFGFHVGGIDEHGVSHETPLQGEVLLSPVSGSDGLPDTEFLVFDWFRYDPAIRKKVGKLLHYLDLVMEDADVAILTFASPPLKQVTIRIVDG
jgi:hypothetical protein